MQIVTRRVSFSAAHRLYNPAWNDEKNNKFFGLCANPAGHGHNYILEVSVAGTINKATGYIIDLKLLKEIIHKLIVDPCDHKHLNHDVPFLKDIIPTVENLAECFFHLLAPEVKKISHGTLYSMKVYETENNWAECKHDGID